MNELSANHVECSSLTEPLPVLAGPDEGFDHLSVDEVAAVLFELPEPEVITSVVRVLWVVRVAPQVAEILHQDERAIEFPLLQGLILSKRA